MQEILVFLMKYWYFSAPFVLILIWLIIEEARSRGLFNQLTPQAAVQLINHQHAVVIDIRDRPAFKQGHIIHSVNIPQSDINTNPSSLNHYRDKTVILTCANGQTSGTWAIKLRKQGFTDIQVLAGGIDSWKHANLPLKT